MPFIYKKMFAVILGGIVVLTAACFPLFAQEGAEKASLDVSGDPLYQEYLTFFRKVFAMMQENYYHPVDEESFQKFLSMFNQNIYSKLKAEKKSNDYIRWRSAAYLVDYLKADDDRFSAFMPPKAADDYEKKVLGKRIDLGIDGKSVDRGYQVSWVEPRSDAHEKGLSEGDILYRIGSKKVRGLTEKDIKDLLTPMEGDEVVLRYFDHSDGKKKKILVISKEYFRQCVFQVPVDVDGVYCIRLEKFNRMTAEDMTQLMIDVFKNGIHNLIIDLRGNPGGPPLAARLISGFFLPSNEEFAYFQRRDRPKAWLSVPQLPPYFHYTGRLIILIDEKSGSASELFSGILQGRKRAVLMGENSAGQVFLKSMFYFDDDSMVLLVTARGHHPNGDVFPFSGLTPDIPVKDAGEDLVTYAARYLAGLKD